MVVVCEIGGSGVGRRVGGGVVEGGGGVGRRVGGAVGEGGGGVGGVVVLSILPSRQPPSLLLLLLLPPPGIWMDNLKDMISMGFFSDAYITL